MKEEYSKEITDNVCKISEYYKEHDDFLFQRRIIMFMIDVIENYIAEKYFVISKKMIHSFITEAIEIWENDGSDERLGKLNVMYIRRFQEVKPFDKRNPRERAAMDCMLGVLSNGHDDPTNQFVYDFLELFISSLEVLNVREKYVRELLNKHFPDFS